MKEQHLRASNHLAEPVTRARRRCCRHGSSARCRYGERDTAVIFGERTARGSKREARVGSRVLSRLVEHVLRSHSRSHGDRKRHPALKLRRVTSRSWRHPTTELALLRAFRGMPELQRIAESAAWVPCLSMPVSMPVVEACPYDACSAGCLACPRSGPRSGSTTVRARWITSPSAPDDTVHLAQESDALPVLFAPVPLVAAAGGASWNTASAPRARAGAASPLTVVAPSIRGRG